MRMRLPTRMQGYRMRSHRARSEALRKGMRTATFRWSQTCLTAWSPGESR